MARADVFSSNVSVPLADQVKEATYYDQRHHGRQSESEDRRRRDLANPARASLFDLLFEEVDRSPDIDEPVKRRLKRNVRRTFGKRNRGGEAHQQPKRDSNHADDSRNDPSADLVRVVVPTKNAEDTEHLIQMVAAGAAEAPPDNDPVLEARRIASQLRYCLAQHTETSQKVSAYLRALLVLTHGNYKPTLVIEI